MSLKPQFNTVAEMVEYAHRAPQVEANMLAAELIVQDARRVLLDTEDGFSSEFEEKIRQIEVQALEGYQNEYVTFMRPFIASIMPGARHASRTDSLVSRANGFSIGERIITDASSISGMVNRAAEAQSIYDSFFPTHQDKILVTKAIESAYTQVADTVVKLAIKIAGAKIEEDAKSELGKTAATVSYLTSPAFNQFIEDIESDPQAAVMTGTKVYDAKRNLVTSWDQIDGGVFHVDFYPETAVYPRDDAPLDKNKFNIVFPASNYTIGTYVTDPLHGYRLGVPVATKTPSNTSDAPAVFLTIAQTAVAEAMANKGATPEEIRKVREDFMPIVRGRVGLE
jgi:hypothetical protein